MRVFSMGAAVLGLVVTLFSTYSGFATAKPEERTAPLNLGLVDRAPREVDAEIYDPKLDVARITEALRSEIKTISSADIAAAKTEVMTEVLALKKQSETHASSIATLTVKVETLSGTVAQIQKQMAQEAAANNERFAKLEATGTSVASASIPAAVSGTERLVYETQLGIFDVIIENGNLKKTDGTMLPNGASGSVYVLKADGTKIPKTVGVPASASMVSYVPNSYPSMDQYQGAPMPQQHYASNYVPQQNNVPRDHIFVPRNFSPQRNFAPQGNRTQFFGGQIFGTCLSGNCGG